MPRPGFIVFDDNLPDTPAMWGENNFMTGVNQFGDGVNYVEFAVDGSMSMHGTARKSDQIKIDARSQSKGASAPIDALRACGASGGVLKPVIQFSKTIQQDIYFEFHAPYSADHTEPVHLHIVWLPGAGWTAGNYVWKMEYLVKNETDPINTGTPTTISADVTPLNAVDMIETEFPDSILFTGDDQILICHLYRDVASDNGDDVGELNMIEMNYIRNKQGENL